MFEILPGLFVGDSKDAYSESRLIHNGIQAIVTAARDHPTPFPDRYEYYECPLLDDETDDVLLHIDEVSDRIHFSILSGKHVLVHCYQGVSRSVAIITGYIMNHRRLEFGSAYRMVCEGYPLANIADNFREQLHAYGTIYGWNMNANTQAHRLFRAKHRLCVDSVTPEGASFRFLCRKCRQCLFLDIHCVGISSDNYRLECLQWMSDQVDASNEGSLVCLRCECKVGHFNWCGLMGDYANPGFIVTGSKVDRMPMSSAYKGDGFPKTKF